MNVATIEQFYKEMAHFNLPVDGEEILIIGTQATEDKPLLIYWHSVGGVVFSLQEDGQLSDVPPVIYPVERIDNLHYAKKLLTSDILQFELASEKISLTIPHRTKLLTQQKEALRRIRQYFEKV